MRQTNVIATGVKSTAAIGWILQALLYLMIIAVLACGCALQSQNSPALDVFIPPHAPVISPSPDVPPHIAQLSGAWQGVWDDGTPSVLVVRRVDSKTADLLLAENQYGDETKLPWHLWARAMITGYSPGELKWEAEWGAFEFRLSDDGRKLTGAFRRFHAPDQTTTKKVSMTRRPIQSISRDKIDPPFVCGQSGKTLQLLAGQADPATRQTMVDEFIEKAKENSTPLLETGSRDSLTCATFIYHGAVETVALAGVMNGFNNEKDFLTRVPGTNLFYLCQEYPSNARIEYNLAINGKTILDPLNPRSITFGRHHWQNSVAPMPDYCTPPETEHEPTGARGEIENVEIRSRQPEWDRTVIVYLPPGYATGKTRFPVLYLNDGFGAQKYGRTVRVMDNLIQWKKIPPLIVVMVPSAKDRSEEYGLNPEFEAFFVNELVPVIDARFRTISDPEHRGIGGISAGAVASLSLCINHPQVFGKCMAQSTAGMKLEPLLALVRKGPERPIRAYLDVGSFESDFYGRDLVDVAHRLREALIANGCRVRYQEVNEGHGWANWRSRTRDAVSFLFSNQSIVGNET